jgi:hypothetical protein
VKIEADVTMNVTDTYLVDRLKGTMVDECLEVSELSIEATTIEPPPVDTMNKWLIGVTLSSGVRTVHIGLPPRQLSKEEALVFAAWIVSLIGDDERWPQVLQAVQTT